VTDVTFDLDGLLDAVVLQEALAAGRDPALLAGAYGAARTIAAARQTPGAPHPSRATSANRWTAAEQQFLETWAGELGDEEIARRLGRSMTAVRVRRLRCGLRGPMVYADYLTAHDMSRALGIDVHQVCVLIERGHLPAEIAPLPTRKVWRMRRAHFLVWATRPDNWPFFYRSVRRPERLGDEGLRRLIVRQKARWLAPDGRPDEWWTPGEVAAYHGVEHTDVNRAIRLGKLAAVRWGNWMVRRSAAVAPGVRFLKGKGTTTLHLHGTPAGDAFLVLAAAVGIPFSQIARMTRRGGHSSSQVRLAALHRAGHTPWLIRHFGLPVVYREADDALWADWRPLAHRFPRLARAWARWEAGELRRRDERSERNLVNGVLRAAVAWHMGEAAEGRRLAHGLTYCAAAAEVEAAALWREWTAAAEAERLHQEVE
jgi:hypothetical protein